MTKLPIRIIALSVIGCLIFETAPASAIPISAVSQKPPIVLYSLEALIPADVPYTEIPFSESTTKRVYGQLSEAAHHIEDWESPSVLDWTAWLLKSALLAPVGFVVSMGGGSFFEKPPQGRKKRTSSSSKELVPVSDSTSLKKPKVFGLDLQKVPLPLGLPAPLNAQELLDEAVDQARQYQYETYDIYNALLAIGRALEEGHHFEAAKAVYGRTAEFANEHRHKVSVAPAIAGQAHADALLGRRDQARKLYNFAIGFARAEREGTTTSLTSVLVSMIDAGFLTEAMGVARQLQFDNEAQSVIVQALIDRGLLNEAGSLIHGMDTSQSSYQDYHPKRPILAALLAKAWIKRGSFEKGLRFARQAVNKNSLGSQDKLLLPVVRELRESNRLTDALQLVSVLQQEDTEVMAEVAAIRATEMGTTPNAEAKSRFEEAWANLKEKDKAIGLSNSMELYAQVALAFAKVKLVSEARDCFTEAKRALTKSQTMSNEEKLAELARWQAEAGLFDDAEKNLPKKEYLYSHGITAVGQVALKMALAGDLQRADKTFARAEAYHSFSSSHEEMVELAALEFEAEFTDRGIATLSRAVENAQGWNYYHFSKMAKPLLKQGYVSPLLFLIEKSVDQYEAQNDRRHKASMDPSSYSSMDYKSMYAAQDDISKAVQMVIDHLIAAGDFGSAHAAVRQLLRIRKGQPLLAQIAIGLAHRDGVELKAPQEKRQKPNEPQAHRIKGSRKKRSDSDKSDQEPRNEERWTMPHALGVFSLPHHPNPQDIKSHLAEAA